MVPRRIAFLLGVCLSVWLLGAPCAYGTASASSDSPSSISWRNLAPGLEMAEFALDLAEAGGLTASAPRLVALRIDPARYVFTLHMASEDGLHSLPALAKKHGLLAAVNAGMYLPDGKTSTGHLRSAAHVNNPRVAENFGAFFVADPKNSALPPARLLDRVEDDWRGALDAYGLVMQNYRMNTVQGRVIWKKEDRAHSIAVLSQDKTGRILFLFCREPVQAVAFATVLLNLPLNLRTLMYLEGGSEAALLIRAGGVDEVLVGRYASGWGPSGSRDIPLPNVLGIRPRETHK